MRPGVVVSGIGHVGFVMMTLVAWPMQTLSEANIGTVVPVEIVTIAAVTDVRALTPETAEEEPTPVEQASEATPPPTETAPAPPDPRRAPPRDRNELNLASLGDLLNDRREETRPRAVPNAERSDRARRGAGLGAAEQARLEDYIRARGDAHIGRCWRAPVDSANPERLAVVVEIDLDRTGHIRGAPRVLSPTGIIVGAELRAAIDNAVRAVRACDPYPFADDERTSGHYELWRQITYNLDPSNVGR